MKQPKNDELLFAASSFVRSDRILYTPSSFARTNLLYLQETGSLEALAPHTSSRRELLSFLCFAVLEGYGKLTYEGESYPLQQGDIVFVDCWKPYSHSTGEKEKKLWTLQWCHFYGPNAAAIYRKYQERGGRPVIHPQDFSSYTELLGKIHQLAASPDYIRDMRINEKLSTLLTLLMSESWHPERKLETGTQRWNVQQVKAYMDAHYREKISLETMAEKFFVNKSYLARLFKRQYGVTLNTYLQQVRITQAKKMLRFTDMQVEEIGLECGIGDLAYFSRIFKKIEGVSPREYRKLW